MTKDMIPATVSRNGYRTGTRLELRQLWQVPTFLIGIVALVLVSTTRPLWSGGPRHQPDRHLAAARRELADARPNLDRVISEAELVLRNDQRTPVQEAEAHFVLGSAYLRKAEHSTLEFASLSWQQARSHLEQAHQLGVSPEDEPALTYRLGRVCYALNVEAPRVVEYLSKTVPDAADDAFEGYGMLARSYLRLPKPDLRAALETLQKQLGLPSVEENALAQPRLLCGELLYRLEQHDEARKVLGRIGTGAPADILFKARYLRACILQEEGIWTEAIPLWEAVRTDTRAANAGLGRILYYLGLCYRRLERPQAAQAIWDDARKLGGEEGQAAALGLAELRMRAGDASGAIEAFQAALRHVTVPADYQNALLDLTEVRRLFEGGCRWYLQVGEHEAALQLARQYEKVALPGVSQELGAQAALAWGKALLEKAAQAASPEAVRAEEDEARKRFREAAALYESAAGASPNAEAKSEWLWQSANLYLQGQDPTRALPVLERFVALPLPPERLGEAWFVRGEAFRALRNSIAAQADFRHCIKFPGPFAFRARYQLALLEIDQNNLEEAEAILSQNHALQLTDSTGGDPATFEKTLFTLAGLLYQRRDYRMAFVRLQEAVDRFPNNPDVLATRFQLAQCCRQLAEHASQKVNDDRSTPEERTHYRTQRQRFLEMAASHYQRVSDDVAALQTQRRLNAEEDRQGRQAAFAVTECRFDLGQFDEALRLNEALAIRYKGQVEGLLALRQVWQCCGVKFQPDQARSALERLRTALAETPATAFDNSSDLRTRRWWEEWLREKSRPGG